MVDFKMFEPTDAGPEPDKVDWSKPSLAVVACDGNGHGCVLWTAGPHVASLINEAGVSRLDELGLDDAPEGICVWEGVVRGTVHHGMDGTEYDSHLEGSFRDLTDEEWASVRKNECPWDETPWTIKEPA